MESLAVRHRPRRFADLVGQRHVAAVLKQAIKTGDVPQQILFSGSSGLGKTTVARIFAAALNCENPTSDGDCCAACPSCDDITGVRANHPDVIELDAASNGGKDEIREIARRASTTPLRSRHKVYVIDEAHGISHAGGQAFLKLLEEPPPHVIFLLATTDPDKMLRTNRSRCVELELVRPSEEELVGNLVRVADAEGFDLPEHVARACVEATDLDLGVRGTVMTLEKLVPSLRSGSLTEEQVASLLGTVTGEVVTSLVEAVSAGDQIKVLELADQLRSRVSDSQLRDLVLRQFRDQATRGDPAGMYRYMQVGQVPAGRVWTDIGLVRATRPDLDASPEALAAQLDEARRVISELTELVASASAVNIPSTRFEPDPWDDNDYATSPEVTPAVEPDEPVPDEADNQAAPEPAQEVSGADAAGSGEMVARVVEMLSARSKQLAAVLGRCDITFEEGSVTVRVPSNVAKSAEQAGLREAAAEVEDQTGVPVTLLRVQR